MGASQEKSAENTKPKTSTKPKAPSLASIRRNKALSTDGHTARFLYQMLKQLDLKPIDWQEVADKTGIPKGHAARMRYNRFKSQMEALIASEEAIAAKFEDTDEDRSMLKRKTDRNDLAHRNNCQAPVTWEEDMNKRIKLESRSGLRRASLDSTLPAGIKSEPKFCGVTTPYIKPEPHNDEFGETVDDMSSLRSLQIHHPTLIKIEDDAPAEESHNTIKDLSTTGFGHVQSSYMNPWTSYSTPHYYPAARYAPHPLYQNVNPACGQMRMLQPQDSAAPCTPRNKASAALSRAASPPIISNTTQSSSSL
ncbi:hypothetical protein H2198_009573 [Neophaeococcomyces mojaviensis]|uniref:Uncharacterized protein n=1 Tax=Neophaeococcomyces mojaviensis TaxID=3383035 RepID=A0ACC2ZUB0_9EURO|nr:hypothetical protein H2198_009573 [Knufia sp. JES_112]